MMAGNNVGDDVGNVDDRDDGSDNGGNDAGNDAGEWDGRDASGEGGGGLLAEDAAAAAAVATVAAAAYCRGHCFFIVKIFLCDIFMMCGGNWRGHTSPHTLVTLEVCRRTFGWGRKVSSKIVMCK
jgi:hypothetical protein